MTLIREIVAGFFGLAARDRTRPTAADYGADLAATERRMKAQGRAMHERGMVGETEVYRA